MAVPLQASPRYAPQRAILELGEGLFDAVSAADFPEAVLRFRNQRWAEHVGLDELSDAEWIAHFGRFEQLRGSLDAPLALRYHGHQFRVYNPEIGDGRGFLFAQLRDDHGRLLDLGTKGSGQTPYSRFGDGRLTLKGGVREVLATEMLEALGVETSKSFSLIETGEALHRGDEPSPTRSSVLVRLSHSHIRIGTFQRLAYHQDADAMARLVDYCLRNLFGEEPGEAPAVRLLELAVPGIARMAAQFMAAGFVHGVLNSDNINVTGESFDYGPWRFNPTWEPNFTAAYFDQTGLYAFGRQPEAIYWDVMQLTGALHLLAPEEPLVAAMQAFPDAYRAALSDAFLWRLGLEGSIDDGLAFVQTATAALAESELPLDGFFFDCFGGQVPQGWSGAFDETRRLIARLTPRKQRNHPYWSDGDPCSMLIGEVEAIWSAIAERDDWGPFHAKVAAIRRMGEALA